MMAPWNGIWQFRSRGPAQTSLVDKKAASAMRCIAAPTLTLPLERDGLGSPGLLQVFGLFGCVGLARASRVCRPILVYRERDRP